MSNEDSEFEKWILTPLLAGSLLIGTILFAIMASVVILFLAIEYWKEILIILGALSFIWLLGIIILKILNELAGEDS